MSGAGRSRVGGPLRVVGQVVVWTVLVTLLALLTACVLVPRIGGATPYTVLTGSMRPDLPPGTLVVVKPVAFDQVRVGDVITYQLVSGQPEVVTHRVVAVDSALGSGERTLRTRGDANPVADQAPVREVQVRGRLWYALPVVGRVTLWLDPQHRTLLTRLIAGALFVYAATMVVSALRDRRRPTPRRAISAPPR